MRDRIISLMRSKGINSMAELERKADIPSGTMRNLGQGHMPSMDKIRKIAYLLEVSVDWLISGDKKEDPVSKNDIKKESVKPVKASSDPLREFSRMVSQLNDQNMESLLDYLRYLLNRQERD
ncbi:MAG: helix-turn-helix transcriptional regulator [Clostridia bacterium]|nr:helix-turn-helix transcriptional regulator [Clostridia bacterium]